jgi:hypothetical protein
VFIFIAAAAPNKTSLGARNGFSQVAVSVVRAVRPALVNSIYSLSIDERWVGVLLRDHRAESGCGLGGVVVAKTPLEGYELEWTSRFPIVYFPSHLPIT